MPEASNSAAAPQHSQLTRSCDDLLTICAVSVVAAILANVLHEGVGHALTALLSGAQSGLLTTVAWSSPFDSRLVEAAGTLANLAAGLILWFGLRSARNGSVSARYFLLLACGFNLLSGTGYFFFSGISNFGDWAAVISGLNPHWLWRVLLVGIGAASYYACVLVVGLGLVRYVGVPRWDLKRMRKLTIIPYFSAILLLSIAAILNPLGIQLLWESALPATAGGQSGLLWLPYYIPRGTAPKQGTEQLARSYLWITVATALACLYIAVLGHGIILRRWQPGARLR